MGVRGMSAGRGSAVSDQIGKLLERVAREAFKPTGYSFSCWEEVAKVLEERLGPLLRAGQAMRDEGDWYMQDEGVNWDNALTALEGRE